MAYYGSNNMQNQVLQDLLGQEMWRQQSLSGRGNLRVSDAGGGAIAPLAPRVNNTTYNYPTPAAAAASSYTFNYPGLSVPQQQPAQAPQASAFSAPTPSAPPQQQAPAPPPSSGPAYGQPSWVGIGANQTNIGRPYSMYNQTGWQSTPQGVPQIGANLGAFNGYR